MASPDNNTFPVKKTFPVLNMTCASCAASAQSILEHQPGVISAAVNYANAATNIEFDLSVTSTKKLKEALQGIGYDLMIDESEDAKESLEASNLKKYKTLRNKTIGSVVISIPLVITGMFLMDLPYANYIMWALATPVIMLFGQQFFAGAYIQAKHGSANMDT